MFGDLPGLFDRNFVVGFLLPAVVLIVTLGLVISNVAGGTIPGLDIHPGLHSFKLEVTDPDRAGVALGLISLACLVAAILLMVLNRPLVRLLEGYLYPVRWLYPLGRRGYRQLSQRVDLVARACLLERQATGAVSEGTRTRYREILIRRIRKYPDREEFVLPTGFGNVIRAAETYSRAMYGADLIAIWPHMSSVLDPAFREDLDAARGRLNCATNMFFVSVFVLALTIAMALPTGKTASPSHDLIAISTGALVAAIGFYNLSVVAAAEWGLYLRAASDTYLSPLLRKLGYSDPMSSEERRDIWVGLSQGFLYLKKLPARPANAGRV